MTTRKPDDTSLPTRDQLLAFIADNPGRVGKREIARAFGISGSHRRAELNQLLRDLKKEGQIGRSAGRRLELAERALDPDLPHARCRDVEFSFGNRPRLGLRQTRIVQDRPKQHMGVEQQSHSGRRAPLKHLRDLGIPLEHIVGERERPLHGADQRAPDRTIGADDPSDRAAVSGQFDRLSRLGATDEFGELRLGFGNGDLHLYIPSILTNI